MNNIDLLDLLTILSFVLQVENQGNIIDINTVQDDIGKAVSDIHNHLANQDKKIDKILELLENKK